ncbi:hypothetical protein CCP4SC76_7630004 [Gammaproteobacteria bacterium]
MNEFVRFFAGMGLEGVFEDPIPQLIAGQNGEVVINGTGVWINGRQLLTDSETYSAISGAIATKADKDYLYFVILT